MKYYVIKKPDWGFAYERGRLSPSACQIYLKNFGHIPEHETEEKEACLPNQRLEPVFCNGNGDIALYIKELDITIFTNTVWLDDHFTEINIDTLKILKETVL